MTSKQCGDFIANLRKEKNLTQKQLAEKSMFPIKLFQDGKRGEDILM